MTVVTWDEEGFAPDVAMAMPWCELCCVLLGSWVVIVLFLPRRGAGRQRGMLKSIFWKLRLRLTKNWLNINPKYPIKKEKYQKQKYVRDFFIK